MSFAIHGVRSSLAIGILATMVVRPCRAQDSATSQARSPSRISATLGVDAASVSIDDYLRADVGSLLASAWVNNGLADGAVNVGASRFESGHVAAYVGAQSEVRLFATPTVRATWQVDAAGGAFRQTRASAYAVTGPRINYRVATATWLWAAGGVGRAGDASSYNITHALVGATARVRAFGGSSAFETVHTARITYSDVTSTLAWTPEASGRAAVETITLSGGFRVGDVGPGVRSWLRQRAVVRVAPRVAIIVAHGTVPPDLLRASRGVNYTSAGLQLRFGAAVPARNTFRELADVSTTYFVIGRPAADTTRALTIQIRGATDLEIMGDFTAWRPVRMTRLGSDVWTARLRLEPGVHHANIRWSGGDWTTVPTLPITDGDFGPVSVFVVQ